MGKQVWRQCARGLQEHADAMACQYAELRGEFDSSGRRNESAVTELSTELASLGHRADDVQRRCAADSALAADHAADIAQLSRLIHEDQPMEQEATVEELRRMLEERLQAQGQAQRGQVASLEIRLLDEQWELARECKACGEECRALGEEARALQKVDAALHLNAQSD